MKLRPYQAQYITQIIKGYPKNMQPLVHLATGGGKSVIFKELAKKAIKQNKKVLFMVAGTSILDQAAKKHFSEISDDVSVMQGTRKYTLSEILCCSVDTFCRRESIQDEIIKEYDMIIIDEAHHCTAERYVKVLNKIPKNKWVIGFTATPYKIGKAVHHYWSNVIKEISVEKLVEQGFLMEPKIYAAPIMSSKVKVVGGDFNNKLLFEENNKLKVYSDIISEYKKHCAGMKAICFAINKQHSKMLAQEFTEAGFPAVHADADTPLEEREKIIKQLENGEIKIICNVNIFSTGVDIPQIECGIMARPTKSLVLWIQQVGRVLRIHPEAKNCIILDHGGNCQRLAHPLEDLVAETDAKAENKLGNEKKPPEERIRTCKLCFFILPQDADECPECGHENKSVRTIQEEHNAKLLEIKRARHERLKSIVAETKAKDDIDLWAEKYVKEEGLDKFRRDFLKRRFRIAREYGQKPNFIFYKAYDRFGDDMQKFLRVPRWFREKHNIPELVDMKDLLGI